MNDYLRCEVYGVAKCCCRCRWNAGVPALVGSLVVWKEWQLGLNEGDAQWSCAACVKVGSVGEPAQCC